MATATADKTASVLDRPIAALFQFTWEKIAYAGLIVAAFITRFYDLGARVMSHDESLHTQWSWYLFQGRGFQHTPLMHGPLKFEVTAFLYWLLGDNDFTSRIPAALAGVAAVWLCYFFRKWLGRAGALSAAVLMLISPYQLYYSRYIRDEPLVMVWGLLLALLVFNYVEKRDNRLLYWLSALMALFYATMETSFIYIALAMLFLGVYFLWELTVTAWPGGSDQARSGFWISLGVAALAAVVGVAIFFYLDRLGLSGTAFTPSSADPDSPAANPGAAAGTAMSLLFLAAALAGGVAVFFFVRAFRGGVRDFPAFNLLVVMLAFALPQLTAFPVRALHRDPQAYTLPPVTGTDLFGNLAAILSSDAGVTLMVMLALLGASLAGGIFWNSRVFLICAGIFYGLYIPLFTTFFTNGGGIMTGIVGSLGYWLDQHAVRRASQPWYYYLLINLPVYEFLPVLAALMAAGLGLRRLWRGSQPTLEGAAPAAGRRDFPGLLFIAWWSVMALPAFSIAGEKMPWLTTHIVLPLILIGGWAIGWFIERIDWQHFAARRAWLVAAILPLTLLALTALFGTLLGTNRPFQGTELNQLQDTGVFVSALIVSGIGLYALYQLGAPLGWGNVARLAVLAFFGLLALVTARTAFVATYINYDAANEYLVYAHGARGVKTVMEQIDDISERTTDGLGLRVAYDDDVSWPMTWYLRDYDNAVYYAKQPTRDALNSPVVLAASTKWSQVESLLGDRYYQYEYIRMVWPMQDYFYMTAKSVRHGLILAPSQCHSADDLTITAGCENLAGGLWSNARYRQALWNIWFSRDYSLYGELTNGNFELSQWPVNDRMRMYVRKDIAAQIWPFGVGPTQLAGEVAEDPYLKGKQTIPAVTSWGGLGQAAGQFDGPRGLAIGPDGSIYVADQRNHRIQKFDPGGNLLLSFGAFGRVEDGTGGPGDFNEPWGVAVGPDGSIFVADTWNHRIQKFDADGNFITAWGVFAQDGDFNSLYGPRALAIDSAGRVFVADTGNDRIVVYDANGRGLTSIGLSGFGPGELDEPVGVAVGPDGLVYVADTWNGRVQVFQFDPVNEGYLYLREWPINGWFGTSVENKPYLAVSADGMVYLTDPEGYRVLAFQSDGTFVATWGDYGTDATAFSLPIGIAADSAGGVYVSDAGANRVMQFPPFPR